MNWTTNVEDLSSFSSVHISPYQSLISRKGGSGQGSSPAVACGLFSFFLVLLLIFALKLERRALNHWTVLWRISKLKVQIIYYFMKYVLFSQRQVHYSTMKNFCFFSRKSTTKNSIFFSTKLILLNINHIHQEISFFFQKIRPEVNTRAKPWLSDISLWLVVFKKKFLRVSWKKVTK